MAADRIDGLVLAAEAIRAARVDQGGPRVLDVRYDRRLLDAGAVFGRLGDAGYGIVDIATHDARLEDIFLALTGHAPVAEDA